MRWLKSLFKLVVGEQLIARKRKKLKKRSKKRKHLNFSFYKIEKTTSLEFGITIKQEQYFLLVFFTH